MPLTEKSLLNDDSEQSHTEDSTTCSVTKLNMSDLNDTYFDNYKNYGILLLHELRTEGYFGVFYIEPNSKKPNQHKLYKIPIRHKDDHFEVLTFIPLLKTVYSDFNIALKDKLFIKVRTYKGKNMKQEGYHLWKFLKDFSKTGLPFSDQADTAVSQEAMNPMDFCGLIHGGINSNEVKTGIELDDWSVDNMPNWHNQNSAEPIRFIPEINLKETPVMVIAENGYFSINCEKIPDFDFRSKIPDVFAFGGSMELKTVLALKLYFDYLDKNPVGKLTRPAAMILPMSELTDLCVFEHFESISYLQSIHVLNHFNQVTEDNKMRNYLLKLVSEVLNPVNKNQTVMFLPNSRYCEKYYEKMMNIEREAELYEDENADKIKSDKSELNSLDKFMLSNPPDSNRKVVKVMKIGKGGSKSNNKHQSIYKKARYSKSSDKILIKSVETNHMKIPEIKLQNKNNLPEQFSAIQQQVLTRFLLDAIAITMRGGTFAKNRGSVDLKYNHDDSWLFLFPHIREHGKFGSNQVEGILHFIKSNKFKLKDNRLVWVNRYSFDTIEGLIQEFLKRTGTTHRNNYEKLMNFKKMKNSEVSNRYLSASEWSPVQTYTQDRDTRHQMNSAVDDPAIDNREDKFDGQSLNAVRIYQTFLEYDKSERVGKNTNRMKNGKDSRSEIIQGIQIDEKLINDIKMNDFIIQISPFNNNKTIIGKENPFIDFHHPAVLDILGVVTKEFNSRFNTNLSIQEFDEEIEITLEKDSLMCYKVCKKNHTIRMVDVIEYTINYALNEIFEMSTSDTSQVNWMEIERRLYLQITELLRALKPSKLDKLGSVNQVKPRVFQIPSLNKL